ncbi:MAG: hypothetical protein ACR2NO_02490 [Chloroflexota bacterium]
MRNSNVKEPPDLRVPVWRYVDLGQLISLLDKRALWFSQVERLAGAAGADGDPFEGSHPALEVGERVDRFFRDLEPDHQRRSAELFSDMNRRWRKVTYVNCWHMNERESAAMWRVHLGADEGVAIRSTFERLTASLSANEFLVFVGTVDYIDYRTERLANESTFAPILTKRRSFEHEREVRAMLRLDPVSELPVEEIPPELFVPGVSVAVDLETLLESVYVAPGAPRWFREVVESVVDKYGAEVPVMQSGLDDAPLF